MNVNLFVPSIIEGYQNYLIYKNRKITRTVKYINIVRKFHNYIGKSYIDVEQRDIVNYFNFLVDFEHIKYNTLTRHLAGINLFYKYLLARGDILQNPCNGIHIDHYLNLKVESTSKKKALR